MKGPLAWHRWTLRRRLWTAIGLALAVTAVGAVITATAVISLGQQQARLTRIISPAVVSTQSYLKAMLDQETGVRGYQLSKDARFLDPYVAGRADAATAARTATDLLSGDPALADMFAQEYAAGQTWQRDYAAPTVAQIARGSTPTTAQLQAGRELFDQIRAASVSMSEALTAERAAARDSLNRTTVEVVVILACGLSLILLAFVLLVVLLRRWVTMPIERLALETRLVSSGDYDYPVVGTGPPDVIRLGGDVDIMRREIADSLLEATALRDTAEQQAAVLARQASELSRSNAELEQFAYIASHDLQEPLRKVASFTQLLQQRYEGQLDDDAHQYIEFAVDGAKRMQQLILDLLNFSRVGRTDVASGWVDLDVCLHHAQHSLGQLIAETGATVRAPALPTVWGTESLLTQLFQNLIGNAVKFHGQDAPIVDVGCERDGADWHLHVQDNGIGIDARYADKIFVIFQRLHPKDAYPGTGIGLALCRKIVEQHGGSIWLGESAGVGARFDWTIPADGRDKARRGRGEVGP